MINDVTDWVIVSTWELTFLLLYAWLLAGKLKKLPTNNEVFSLEGWDV